MSNVAGPSKIDPGTYSKLSLQSLWRMNQLLVESSVTVSLTEAFVPVDKRIHGFKIIAVPQGEASFSTSNSLLLKALLHWSVRPVNVQAHPRYHFLGASWTSSSNDWLRALGITTTGRSRRYGHDRRKAGRI